MLYYEAQSKQILFHNASAEEVLYGGAAGGGKSYSIIWDAVTFAMKYDKVVVSIFRRTYPELEKSIILEALKSIPATWYNYNKHEHRMYFRNGSIIEFNYCQYENDVYNFQSAQWDRLYFDELTHFPKFIYLYLLSRLRTTRTDFKPQAKSGSNPGNIGHEWVKQRFIKDAIRNKIVVRTDPETGSTYTTQYIPAKLSDNAFLTQTDDYKRQLMKLPPDERKALLDGDWDVLKGQFFSEWRYDIHVCEPFEIPKWWTRIRGMDWGYTKPAAVIWIAFSPEGEAYIYKELIVTEHTDSMLASKILGMSSDENVSYTMADPSLWSISQYERGESIAMRFGELGVDLIKGDNNRLAGWNVIHSYLYHDDNKKPKLKVFNTCNYVIETIPGLIHDQNKPEDINTDGEDHAADAIRYALMTRPNLPKTPVMKAPTMSFEYWHNKIKSANKKEVYVGKI